MLSKDSTDCYSELTSLVDYKELRPQSTWESRWNQRQKTTKKHLLYEFSGYLQHASYIDTRTLEPINTFTAHTCTTKSITSSTLQQFPWEKILCWNQDSNQRPSDSSSCQGITFLTGIWISPFHNFALIGSQFYGRFGCGHYNHYCSTEEHYQRECRSYRVAVHLTK